MKPLRRRGWFVVAGSPTVLGGRMWRREGIHSTHYHEIPAPGTSTVGHDGLDQCMSAHSETVSSQAS